MKDDLFGSPGLPKQHGASKMTPRRSALPTLTRGPEISQQQIDAAFPASRQSRELNHSSAMRTADGQYMVSSITCMKQAGQQSMNCKLYLDEGHNTIDSADVTVNGIELARDMKMGGPVGSASITNWPKYTHLRYSFEPSPNGALPAKCRILSDLHDLEGNNTGLGATLWCETNIT